MDVPKNAIAQSPPAAPPDPQQAEAKRLRRHSTAPIRSSPLAGPAIFSAGTGTSSTLGRATGKGAMAKRLSASAPSSRSPSVVSLSLTSFVVAGSKNTDRPKSTSTSRSSTNAIPIPNPNPHTRPKSFHTRATTSPGAFSRPQQQTSAEESWLATMNTPRFSRRSMLDPGIILPIRKDQDQAAANGLVRRPTTPNSLLRRPTSLSAESTGSVSSGSGSGSVPSLSTSASSSRDQSLRRLSTPPDVVVTAKKSSKMKGMRRLLRRLTGSWSWK